MLGVFFEGVSRVIYCSLYVGLSGVGHNLRLINLKGKEFVLAGRC